MDPHMQLLEKVVSSYKHMLNATICEDTLMRKYQTFYGIFYNLNRAYENNSYLGQIYLYNNFLFLIFDFLLYVEDNFLCIIISGSSNRHRLLQELKEQRSILRNSIEKLKTSESLRAALISHLKEALNQ
jgi:regulator of Ty1 transposition protein 103